MQQSVQTVFEKLQGISAQSWSVVAGAMVSIPIVNYALTHHRCRKMKEKCNARANRSKKNIEALKSSLENYSIRTSLVKLDFSELQEKLQSGEVTPTEVLRAFQAKAIQVNEQTNAVTDVITRATEVAVKLEGVPQENRGDLYGIPISLKESCGLAGEDCTAGFGEMIGIPKTEDGILVQVLLSKGAVPFVRTNIPQGMRSFACTNPIYGQTKNPHDSTRSAGGSSGGEGALIGGHGSILGVGSDIAGSVRIPAAFCGICALKPTSGRLSSIGNFAYGSVSGQKIVPPTDGPMGRDVSTLVSFMKEVLGPELFRRDPSLPPVPFREEVFTDQRPLRIGYYLHDGCTMSVPAVQRAVLLAKSVLEKKGQEVVEIKPYRALYAFNEIMMPALFGDDAEAYTTLLKYDRTDKIMYSQYLFNQRPHLVRLMVAKLRELRTYDPVVNGAMGRQPMRTIIDWFEKTLESRTFVREFTEDWISQKVDAVICPCLPMVACKQGMELDFFATMTYTGLYNVVNYPVGVVPVTKVSAGDEAKTHDPAFYKAKTAIEKLIREDSKGTEGLPVGIQVVALPFMEELVLRVMKEIETGLTGDQPQRLQKRGL